MAHALIIGAGVAGPVLSMALQRVGIESSIFERDLSGAEECGSWLNFQVSGDAAVSRWQWRRRSWLPALYIAGATVILLVLFAYRPGTTWPGMAIVAAGAPVYFLIRRRNPASNDGSGR